MKRKLKLRRLFRKFFLLVIILLFSAVMATFYFAYQHLNFF
jgi:hypothetical protein